MRSHTTSLTVFSIALSLSLVAGSLFYGFKAGASSPIFYDATVTFYSSDYTDSVTTADFSYHSYSFTEPFYNSAGLIKKELGSYLTTNSTTGILSSAGSMISITSPELMRNGGHIYLGYIFAFFQFGNYNYDNLKDNYELTTYPTGRYSVCPPGSIDISNDFRTGTTLTFTKSLANNTSIDGTGFDLGNNGIVRGFNAFDGSNFPVGIATLSSGSTSQLLEDYNLTNSKFYNYDKSYSLWWRSSLYMFDIAVEPMDSQYWDYSIVMRGSSRGGAHYLTSYNLQSSVTVDGQTENLDFSYIPIVYICPVYAYVVSNNAYEPMQEYMEIIGDKIDDLSAAITQLYESPTSEQLTWLENMRRQAVLASQAAASFATRGAYEFTTPVRQELQQELMDPIRSQEMRPFLSLLSGFLNHTKILAILTIAIVASIIGFIFFGKRG